MAEYTLAVTEAFLYSQNVVSVPYKRGSSAPNIRESDSVAQNPKWCLRNRASARRRPSLPGETFGNWELSCNAPTLSCQDPHSQHRR
jgi:hypothetical protein